MSSVTLSAPSIIAEDPRRCANGAECANKERLEDRGRLRWVGKLLPHEGGLCLDCVGRVERAIRALPADVRDLDKFIAPTSSGMEIRVSGTHDPQLNVRPEIESLRAKIDYETVYWAECVGMESPVGMRLEVRVFRACRWMAPRVHRLVWLGSQERSLWSREGEPVRDAQNVRETAFRAGVDGARALAQLHHQVRVVTGRTRLVHRLTPACPICDERALVRQNGGSHVECESCGKKIDERHYDWFVQITLSGAAA